MQKRWHWLAYSGAVTAKTEPLPPLLIAALQDAATQAAAYSASGGHLDELRNAVAVDTLASKPAATPAWQQFLSQAETRTAADLDQRFAGLQRQIRDNGVTYNVYADEDGPQRPWSLDLFPLLIEPQRWAQIEAGVLQRTRLLEQVLADVYGPQQLLKRGLLPPALIQGHPGYLRSMHGVTPVGGVRLHIAAYDLAHGPDGNWWVVGQRCQAPSGLGYLLENRMAVSGQFPQALEALRVQHLASTYAALMASLKSRSPAGEDAHLALLTPGPYNETYFEHAYLARYLGLSLVEGGDLMVRDDNLYLKTLKGLVPVHGLLKRVDDDYLDPLELRADSTLGVPGLLQAIRAGRVLVANAPGTAFLESPALLGFLPGVAEHLLGQSLSLPALPTWWCGERSAMEAALPQLQDCVIKPSYPASGLRNGFDAVLGRSLSARQRDEWAGRILRQGEEHTLQAYLPLSQMPTWQAGRSGAQPGAGILPRSVMLRVFVVSDPVHGWRVLPGGMARVASAAADVASMQLGGSSADVWALAHDVPDSAAQSSLGAAALLAQRKRPVTSRAAENLYWLGRYTERTEHLIRLARLTLECLHGEEQSSAPLTAWLGQMAVVNTLVLPGVPAPAQARRVFERSLIDSLGSSTGATSVGYNLRALKMAGSAVRERLSQEHWRVMVRAEEELTRSCAAQTLDGDDPAQAALAALQTLKHCGEHMAAITGAQTDRMTRDDGWRLLSIGRQIERLGFVAQTLHGALQTESVHTVAGFEALLDLFDSSITFRAHYERSRDIASLVDLLVLNGDNPRSLACVAQTLRGRLNKLANGSSEALSPLAQQVPEPSAWRLAELCEQPDQGRLSGAAPALLALLEHCQASARRVSEEISATYFTHASDSKHSVGTP